MALEKPSDYALAVIVGLGAFFVVGLVLRNVPDSDCYQIAVSIDIVNSGDRITDCAGSAFEASNASIDADRARLETDPQHVVDQPSETAGRSLQIVWVGLISTTVGLAFGAATLTNALVKKQVSRSTYPAYWRVGARSAVGAVAIALLILWGLVPDDVDEYSDLYGAWMDVLVLAVLLPGSFIVVGLVALYQRLGAAPDLAISDLSGVARVLTRLSTLLGALLSLGIVTTGARWQMIDQLPGAESVPSSTIFLYGGVFTAIAAAAYLPTRDRFMTKQEAAIAKEVNAKGSLRYSEATLRAKKALRDELDADHGTLTSLQGSLAILAPAFSAAVSAVLA